MNLVKRCITATLAISLLALVFSCENNALHVHTFSEKWTYDSTHHWHAPTCDDTNEVDGKGEHKFGEGKITKEATVDADGEQTYTCTVCGYEKKEVIEKHKHVFSTDWTANDNYHWYAATCGHEDAVEKVKHSFDDGVFTKEATETEEGEKTYTCSICGKKKIVKTGTSDHKHTYESTVSYDETYHWYKPTCAHTNEIKDKEKHSYGDGVTVEPTCTEDGKTTYKCTKCDYSYSETIPKKGHSFESTWSSDEEYHWHAATCEHSDAVVKEKHTFDKCTVKTEATCVADGTTAYTCSTCNKSVDKNVGKNENNHSGTLSYKYGSYLTKTDYKEYCSQCNKPTGKVDNTKEKGVDSIIGYWVSEECEVYGHTFIEALSFDNSGEAILELYCKYNDKFVLMENGTYDYSFKWSEDTITQFILKYKSISSDSDESTEPLTMTMDVREDSEDSDAIIGYGDNGEGVELSAKHIKKSDTVHSHIYSSSLKENDYLNVEGNPYCHYVPTDCNDENLHEKFYLPEKHIYEEETTTYKCTKCGAVKPWIISFTAEGADYSNVRWFNRCIDRSETTFTTTEAFEGTDYDGTTYCYTGISSWKTVQYGNSYQSQTYGIGQEITLSDGLNIYFTYSNVTIKKTSTSE